MKTILILALVFMGFVAPVSASQVAGSVAVGLIPIQHGGRIKPFAAFAHELVQSITGKARWQGSPAVDVIMSRLARPEQFLDVPFIRIDHPGLKEALGILSEKKSVSYHELQPVFKTLESIVAQASVKRQKEERLSALEQQADILYERLATVDRLSRGEMITVMPVPGKTAWASPFTSNMVQSKYFLQLVKNYADKDPKIVTQVDLWIASVVPSLEKDGWEKVKMEGIYYAMEPFYYAGILYLIGFILLVFSGLRMPDAGCLALFIGFVFHTAGLLLRTYILSRPPVANMYETMIFMDWVLMICVGCYAIFQKRRSFLSSGALASVLVMLYANLLPVSSSLDVLSPVLRSSYWLMIHVMTIMASYSFFTLAMAISHRYLFLAATGKLTADEDKGSALAIYRILQAGLIALGAGTILGGVWANETWGRFWGWDPKETWAFITFLGYMAILHLRYSRKLTNWGLAVASLLGFLLVLMTWYGVNFVLGRGLHSYGAGSGGLEWIMLFLVLEAGFLGGMIYLRKRRG